MLSNDTGIHAPLLSGLYDYNAFKIGAVGFPVVGGTYLDPIFGAVNPEGSLVRRLTDVGDMTGFTQDIYAHHYINADNTSFFWTDSGGTRVIRKISDGSIVRSGISWSSSGAGDVSWHPTDPNSYFYTNGSDIRKYDVAAGTSVRVNSAGKFPSALQDCGGFLDFVDATATKFCVQYGGSGYVYDSTTDTTYSGTPSPAAGGAGVWGMLPNAAYAVYFTTNTALADPSDSLAAIFWAFPLDNVNHVLGTHFRFWDDTSGSHCSFACASNGKTYMFRAENTSNGYYYIVEVKDQGSNPHSTIIADSANTQLFTNGWLMDTHYSGSIIGANRDWIFFDTEDLRTTPPASDLFDGGVSGWGAYEQEIMAVNVLTHEVRRFAHHRSRSLALNYDYQPKVSCSWDGGSIMFLSNYNYQGTDASDGFAIQNPLGVAAIGFTPPPPPSLLGRNLYVMP